jgi:excisionase family DNA binding protein
MLITLADLLEDPRKVGEIPPADLPPLLCHLVALQGALTARLLTAAGEGAPQHPPLRLLTVAEAAARLGVSKDWVYRRAGKLPFTVRLGPRRLRFSPEGIHRFIHQREGKA